MNKKILLINPPQEYNVKVGIEDDFIEIIGYYPPLGLLYIGTVLKNLGYEVKILDCVPMKIGYSELRTEIQNFAPYMVGVTTYTMSMHDVLLCVNIAKEINPATITVLGGHHPTLYPKESLRYKNVDYIIHGEGEESLVELLDALERKAGTEELAEIKGLGFFRYNKEFLNLRKAYVKDLDSLPIPDRSLLPSNIYMSIVGKNKMLATVMSSRGCPFQCTFCFTPNKTYRSRSNENIIKEINYLIEIGFKEVFFFDDLFALKAAKVIEFSNALLENNIKIDWSFRGRISSITEELIHAVKKTGVHRIQFGIESGMDKTLKRIKKGTNTKNIREVIQMCKKNGIQTVGNFIIGLPDETKEDIEETLKFSRSIGLTYGQYSVLMPFPFTEIYTEALEKGYITHDFWKDFVDDPIGRSKDFKMQYWEKEVSAEYLFKTVAKAFKKFYFRPVTVINKLKEIDNFQEFKNAVVGALSVFKFNPKV